MEAFAPYLICFLAGSLLAWLLGYAEFKLSPAHKVSVGTAKKVAIEAASAAVRDHEAVLITHEKRLQTVEQKVHGDDTPIVPAGTP